LRIEAGDDASAPRAREQELCAAVGRHQHPGARDVDARLDAVALADAGVRRRCKKPGRGDDDDDREPQPSLLNQMPEMTAPTSRNASPPAAAADVTSTFLCVCPTRDPSSAKVAPVSTPAAPETNLPPLSLAIPCRTLGATGTMIRSVNPPWSFWLTTPCCVPRAIAVTGIFESRANCEAWSGVIRPAVWPPS